MDGETGEAEEEIVSFVAYLPGLIAMTVLPIVLGLLSNSLGPLLTRGKNITVKYLGRSPYEQQVRHVELENEWAERIHSPDAPRNDILLKVLKMYVGLALKPPRPYLRSEELLWSIKEAKDKEKPPYEWEEDREVIGTSSKSLDCYQLVVLPEPGCWEEVAPNIWFQHTSSDITQDNERDGKEKPKMRMTEKIVRVRSYHKQNPEQEVKKFIDEAFAWYSARRKETEDKGRFMYQIYHGGKKKSNPHQMDDGDAPVGQMYKRYKLSEDRTFSTLFIPGKKELLSLVDAFLAKEGNFAKPGFPDKLGLLLHGPPGTGKTSLIKCLAQYTKRNIVNINLARVTTNQELMDLMYDCSFQCMHEDEPRRMDWDEIIFVMEDIDCASDVIKARKQCAQASPDLAPVVRPSTDDEAVLQALQAAAKAQKKNRIKFLAGVRIAQLLKRRKGGKRDSSAADDKEGGEEEEEEFGLPRCATDDCGRELELLSAVGGAGTQSWETVCEDDDSAKDEDGSGSGSGSGSDSDDSDDDVPDELIKAFDACARGEADKPEKKEKGKKEKEKEKEEKEEEEEEGEKKEGDGEEGKKEKKEKIESPPGGWPDFAKTVSSVLGSVSLLKGLDDATLREAASEHFAELPTKGGGVLLRGKAIRELTKWASTGDCPAPPGKADSDDDDDDSDSDESEDEFEKKKNQGEDKLNLAGLLNVLDGVVDTPGRIVVMTTNVRQKLDRALIRPGRVNQRLELGFMKLNDAHAMACHYLDDGIDRAALKKVWVDGKVTPAQLEQLCCENETADELLAAIRTRLASEE